MSIISLIHTATNTTTITSVLRPFVQDYPDEPGAEETFTHPHLSWSSIILYPLSDTQWTEMNALWSLLFDSQDRYTRYDVLKGRNYTDRHNSPHPEQWMLAMEHEGQVHQAGQQWLERQNLFAPGIHRSARIHSSVVLGFHQHYRCTPVDITATTERSLISANIAYLISDKNPQAATTQNLKQVSWMLQALLLLCMLWFTEQW